VITPEEMEENMDDIAGTVEPTKRDVNI